MLVPVTLSVPVDAAYREIAVDFAGKFAELSGGTTADVGAFSTHVTAAIKTAANGATSGAALTLGLQIAGHSVVCTIGGQSVRCPISVQPDAEHA